MNVNENENGDPKKKMLKAEGVRRLNSQRADDAMYR